MSRILLKRGSFEVSQSTARELKKVSPGSINKLQELLGVCFGSETPLKDRSDLSDHSFSLSGLLYWISTASPGENSIAGVCVLQPPKKIQTPKALDSKEETIWMIYNVCVNPELHGKGIGRLLLGAVLQEWYFRKQSGDVLGLDVKVCNIPAVRLYLSLGFLPQKCYSEHGELYYVMRLKRFGSGGLDFF